MKILAFDFSSAQRSVAVLGTKDGSRKTEAGPLRSPSSVLRLPPSALHISEVIETSKGHTMQPFAMIESALAQASVERHEIGRIVVGLGPGSYTGIRAGIAMAQGWQLAREVQLLGISSVEAIAAQAQADGLRGAVSAVVDAQRGEFYLATWELSDAGHRELEPLRIVSADAAKAHADTGTCIIGPEVTRWFPSGKIIFPRAATLAGLALDRAGFVGGDALEPIYLRETTFVKAPAPRVV